MRRASTKNRYPAKSLIKALRILDLLAEKPGGCGVTELSEALDIGKSTVHRLLATLKDEGYVVLHPANSRYIMGGKIAKLGQQLAEQNPLLTFAPPIIRRLVSEYNETVNLAILEGNEVVYIAGEECKELLRNHFSLGHRAPAHATGLGKVCLAGLTDEEVRQLYKNPKRFTAPGPKTITTLDALLTELAAVRRAGFSYDNEEAGPGISCIAVPIKDFSGKPVAAMSFSVPKHRMSPIRRPILRDALLRMGGKLSHLLGYTAEKRQRTDSSSTLAK